MFMAFLYHIYCNNDFKVIARDYNIDRKKTLLRDLLQTCDVFALKFNYSIQYSALENIKNISEFDVNIADFEDYHDIDPNPFILPSVLQFYGLTFVIPAIGKVDKHLYFILPFQTKVWIIIFIIYLIIPIILKMFLKNSSIIIPVMILANQPIKVHKIKGFWYSSIILINLFVNVAYSTFLGFFLTTSVDETKFLFLCPEFRADMLEEHSQHIHYKTNDYKSYIWHISNLNMSYGYCLTSLFWRKNLNMNPYQIFRVIKPWKFVYGHYLRINQNSKYLEQFNDYLIKVFSSGLMEKWGRDMKIKNYIKSVQNYLKEENRFLSAKDFQICFSVFSIGLFVGCLVFLFEIFYRKYLSK